MNKKQDRPTFFTAPPYARGNSPLAGARVKAGFPSPADDYTEEQLDLNAYCITNPPATFFVRVDGDSMVEAGINEGDLLVVDRSLEPGTNDIVVAILDGEFTLKRMVVRDGRFFLCPANSEYEPIEITEGMEFEVWGKATTVIHEL